MAPWLYPEVVLELGVEGVVSEVLGLLFGDALANDGSVGPEEGVGEGVPEAALPGHLETSLALGEGNLSRLGGDFLPAVEVVRSHGREGGIAVVPLVELRNEDGNRLVRGG